MIKNKYSIIAYSIKLNMREKGINGTKLEDLRDLKKYQGELEQLVNDFIDYVKGNDYSYKDNYFKIVSEKNSKFCGYDEKYIELRFGAKNGSNFSVFNNNNETKYDGDAKIVRDYVIIFMTKHDKLYMVAFRNSGFSCKTVIEKEIKEFLIKSNLLIEFSLVSNEKYIEEHLGNSNVNSIQFDTIYKVDDGDGSTGDKIDKQKYASISINLQSPKNKFKQLISKFIDLLKGTTKEEILNMAKKEYKGEDYVVDDESFNEYFA